MIPASLTVKDLGSAVGTVVGPVVGPVVGSVVEPVVGPTVGVDAELEPGALLEVAVGVLGREVVLEVGEAEPRGGAALPHAVNCEPNRKSTTATTPKRCLTLAFGSFPLNQWFKLEHFINI